MYLPVTSSRGGADQVSPVLLRALRRLATELGALHGTTASAMTDPMVTQTALRAVTDLVQVVDGAWRWTTFVSLLPSQQIVAHRDPALPAGIVRYHLPLLTNAGCWSYSDGSWQQLTVGTIYTMRPDVVHGAVNWGETVRVHLIVDAAEGAVR